MSDLDNARIVFAKYTAPDEEPREDHFEYEKCPYPLKGDQQLQHGQVLIRNIYLSVDPTLRFRMNAPPYPTSSYQSRWEIGDVIEGVAGIGEVIATASDKYNKGDYVFQHMKWPWQLFFIKTDQELQKVELDLVNGKEHLSVFLSCHLIAGLTVLLGLWVKGHLNEGDQPQTWVVSGAAGSCGALAGQLIKLESEKEGVRVIGICGSEEKCEFLREIGFDGVINYKKENVGERLDILCPRGIDRYFDNVGGTTSDDVISRMTQNGHVVLCGQIANYNKLMDAPYPFPCTDVVENVINQRHITRERFLVLNYPDMFDKGLKKLGHWYTSKKLIVRECFEEGLEKAPLAFVKMMRGDNIGKQLVRVSQP